jgi:hypothetical protein
MTLTVYSTSGLANRLRVLASGLALAEASGRTFRMLWARTPTCAAAFRELFAGEWPVTDLDRPERGWRASHLPLHLPSRSAVSVSDPRPEIFLGANGWLVDVREPSTQPELSARCAQLLARLDPLASLSARMAEFRRQHFRPTMIGVHLRRGDFLRHRPDTVGNTEAALAAVERFLVTAPDAGILLCTDDGAADPRTREASREGVREIMRARFGDRVVFTSPRSLDRGTPEGVQDALVDLWLLRSTQMVVGTRASSYSALAAFGRGVPLVMAAGPTPAYRSIERLVRVTGVDWLVRHLLTTHNDGDALFWDAWRRFTLPVRQWSGRRKRRRRQSRAWRKARWASLRRRWGAMLGFTRPR